MNTEKSDHMKKEGAWEAVHEAFNTEVPEPVEKHLHKALNAFRQDMREHPYVRRLERHGFPLRQKLIFFSRLWIRPFVLASMGLAVLVIVGSFILGNKPPTWAEVQERFGTMPFFTASIYRRDVKIADYPLNALVEPKFVELWVGYGNRIRIRSGSKVTFAEKGKILNTFDLITRTETYADSITYTIVNKAGKSDTISLNWILVEENPLAPEHIPEWFPKEWKSKEWNPGGLVDTTSRVISDPAVSKDIVVFDHEFYYAKAKYGRARVWALRKSRLPIRVVMWPMDDMDDINGRLVRSPVYDMIFTYSKEQPKQFFDPKAFASKLKDPANSIESLMYMFHYYPGGNSQPTPGS
jgi:hypothetical protein